MECLVDYYVHLKELGRQLGVSYPTLKAVGWGEEYGHGEVIVDELIMVSDGVLYVPIRSAYILDPGYQPGNDVRPFRAASTDEYAEIGI